MTKGKENTPHIGIFGKRNTGKSSLINSLTGQNTAIVSDTPGTTADPVKKSIEIPGIGPVIFVDTAGIDDTGELGLKRVEKSMLILDTVDLAILVFAENNFGREEKQLLEKLNFLEIPCLIVHNKCDENKLDAELMKKTEASNPSDIIDISAKLTININLLVEKIRETLPVSSYTKQSMLGDLINYGDIVLLITPIDEEAPEGRLILPQVQTIRDILDNDAVAIVLKEKEVDTFLTKTAIKPALAVTDSSIFLKADAMIPKDIPLTGFSILLARMKGNFEAYLKGTPAIGELKDGDRVCLLESCTHHVSCDDIGRVKLPRWITNFTGTKPEFDFVTGLDRLPRPIDEYSLVIQCGGCVVTRRQLLNRINPAIGKEIPVTNYGMAIAYIQGIFTRAIAPFVKNSTNEYI